MGTSYEAMPISSRSYLLRSLHWAKYLGFYNDPCKIIDVLVSKSQIFVPWIGAVEFLLR